MERPSSVKLFGTLFTATCAVSLALAVAAAHVTSFGFPMPPEAAATLAARIFAVRLAGIGFAVLLLAAVVFARSRAARAALGLRWVLGLATSVAFLRGVGVIVPGGGIGPAVMALSVGQLALEGFAIAILYGPDAEDWFTPGFALR